MIGEQKQQIYILRKQGRPFADIAGHFGLPHNTVKTFCWRNGLSDAEIEKPQENHGFMGFCKQCGKPIEQKFKSRPKKFCCDKCRSAWWAENSSQLNRPTLLTLKCENCGAEFYCYPSQRKRFCGHAISITRGIAMKISTADFQKEVDYCAVASIAKSLLQQGLITEKEYNNINAGFIKSYKPDFKFSGGVPECFQPPKP